MHMYPAPILVLRTPPALLHTPSVLVLAPPPWNISPAKYICRILLLYSCPESVPDFSLCRNIGPIIIAKCILQFSCLPCISRNSPVHPPVPAVPSGTPSRNRITGNSVSLAPSRSTPRTRCSSRRRRFLLFLLMYLTAAAHLLSHTHMPSAALFNESLPGQLRNAHSTECQHQQNQNCSDRFLFRTTAASECHR